MKIYTYPRSRSLRVLWTLEELGIAYDTVKVDLFTPDSGVKSAHPAGKVPFLIDGKVSIEETIAICIYICDKYPDATFYPVDPKQKALVNSRLSYALTDLESPIWDLLKQLVFIPEDQRSSDLVNYFKNEASKCLKAVERNNH